MNTIINNPTKANRQNNLFNLASLLTLVIFLSTAFYTQAQTKTSKPAKTFEDHVGHGKVNFVDFRGTPASWGLPLIFRLEFQTFESVKSDGFFGPITKGKMTFSYPRQNNPEVKYDKTASIGDRLTKGPAYGDVVDYQAREIAPNVFEVHWIEPEKGDVVTQIEDFNRQQVATNFIYINREPIPAEFDALDLDKRLNNTTLFPNGNPTTKKDFPFFSLAGKMSQSLVSDKVWEKMHFLVYKPKK